MPIGARPRRFSLTGKRDPRGYVCAWVDPDVRDQLDALARQNRNGRSAEIRRAIDNHIAAANLSKENP